MVGNVATDLATVMEDSRGHLSKNMPLIFFFSVCVFC